MNSIVDKIIEKRCSKCGQIKSASEFVVQTKSRDGLGGYCKSCRHQIYVYRKSVMVRVDAPFDKYCPRCKKTKQADQFGRDKNMRDGLSRACLDCTRLHHKVYTSVLKRKNNGEIVGVVCADCLREKPDSDFSAKQLVKNGIRSICKECWTKRQALEKRHRREYKMNWYYKLPPREFDRLVIEQCGRCAICNQADDNAEMSLVIDHNHATKKFRGIICKKCNIAIGMVNEDPAILDAIKEYLFKHNDRNGGA